MQAIVEYDEIVQYRVNAKTSFEVGGSSFPQRNRVAGGNCWPWAALGRAELDIPTLDKDLTNLEMPA